MAYQGIGISRQAGGGGGGFGGAGGGGGGMPFMPGPPRSQTPFQPPVPIPQQSRATPDLSQYYDHPPPTDLVSKVVAEEGPKACFPPPQTETAGEVLANFPETMDEVLASFPEMAVCEGSSLELPAEPVVVYTVHDSGSTCCIKDSTGNCVPLVDGAPWIPNMPVAFYFKSDKASDSVQVGTDLSSEQQKTFALPFGYKLTVGGTLDFEGLAAGAAVGVSDKHGNSLREEVRASLRETTLRLQVQRELSEAACKALAGALDWPTDSVSATATLYDTSSDLGVVKLTTMLQFDITRERCDMRLEGALTIDQLKALELLVIVILMSNLRKAPIAFPRPLPPFPVGAPIPAPLLQGAVGG